MLDIRKIRDNPDLFRQKLALRHGGDEELVGRIVALDEEIRKLKQQGEALKSERNRASKEIGAIKAAGGDIAAASARVKTIGDEIAQIDRDLTVKDTELIDILLRIPNITHDSVPAGKTAADNRIERVVGQRRSSISRRSPIGTSARSSASSTSTRPRSSRAAASSSSRAPARGWSARSSATCSISTPRNTVIPRFRRRSSCAPSA